jgi:site-specific DNA-methyltransferase (adenine-specific)
MAEHAFPAFKIDRLPKNLQKTFHALYSNGSTLEIYLHANHIYQGDARELLQKIEPNSVAVSVWSPPYFVGKKYEAYLTFEDWQNLLKSVVNLHFPIIKPGGFLVINIADILVFKDPDMPRIQADAINDVLNAMKNYPTYSRYQLAELLNCSEQTIDRRLHGNNIRGGKHESQTRVKIVGGMIEDWALEAGFYPYDRRVWVKDAAWENSRWASLSYRSVDEFEYLYFFWKPGITKYDRNRLSADEWKEWGSRGVWEFPSVRANDDHEAKFPLELPRRVIRLLTDPDEIVLDCFMGSGTTAFAAIQENRQYIGIELENKYVELAKSKIKSGTQKRLISESRRKNYADKP